MLFLLVGVPKRAVAQSGNQLPVYAVTQFGATPSQARLLADALNIPLSQIVLSNGLASFTDVSNYMAVPSVPLTDPTLLRILLHETENEYPAIPIQVQQIDFGALSKLTVLDSATAMQRATTALANAGLKLQYGVPSIGHAKFTAYCSNLDNTVSSNSVNLNTEVDYQFVLPGGYPLEGPGAQVQFEYGSGGKLTRLLYAAPQLATTTSNVQTITLPVALSRAASLMDPTHVLGPLNLSGSTVYHLPHCLPCVEGPIYVLPWVKVEGSALVTNRFTGEISTLDLMPQYIPATDDPRFVPQVNLTAASVGNTQVVAYAAVTGGMPPYSYSWGGSSPSANGSSGPSIGYAPTIRLTPPPLELRMVQALHAVLIHWWAVDPLLFAGQPDPVPVPWVLESATDLTQGTNAWSPVPNIVQNSNGVSSVMVDLTAPSRFFRLRLAVRSVQTTETVQVTVTDANGVTVPAVQTVPVLAQVEVAETGATGVPPPISGVVDWGTESPYDPGLGATDRNDWRTGMILGGAGSERFLWTGSWAWKEDFIDAPTGINDQEVDNADITLYIGHGNPTVFTFTGGPGPNPTTLFYNESTRSWGNHDEEWLCLLSCDVLQFDWNGQNVWQRWGPNFDGLHGLYGFSSLAYAGTGFPFSFAQGMLGWPFLPWVTPMPIVSAWFSAAHARGTGTPAAMGPIGPGGAWDYGDYFWGKGPVGPTIPASQIHGWWYLSY